AFPSSRKARVESCKHNRLYGINKKLLPPA
ncbi:unnamed protein product, partial [Allacma fusca]